MLRRLLAAWAASRHPRLDAALTGIGRELADAAPPLGAGEHAWLARAAGCDPADVELLFAAPPAASWVIAQHRVAALARFAPDPRIARGLLRLASNYPSRKARPLHAAVCEAARPSAYRELTALCHEVGLTGSHAAVYLAFHEHCRRAPRAAPDLALLAELAPPVAAHADALAAAVAADPDDLGARAALADALLAVGDPRGELIALQLALAAGRGGAEAAKRAAALVAQHGPAWFAWLPGRLEEARLWCGALAEATIDAGHPKLAASLGHPGWATLRTLTLCGPLPADAQRALFAGLPHLRQLALTPRATHEVCELVADLALPGVRALAAPLFVLRALHAALPALEVLQVTGASAPALAYATARRLGAAAVVLSTPLAGVRDAIVARAEGPPEIRITSEPIAAPFATAGWCAWFGRDGDAARIAYAERTNRPEIERELGGLLDAFATTGFARVRISGHRALLAPMVERKLADIAHKVAAGKQIALLAVAWDADPVDLAAPVSSG